MISSTPFTIPSPHQGVLLATFHFYAEKTLDTRRFGNSNSEVILLTSVDTKINTLHEDKGVRVRGKSEEAEAFPY